MIYRRDELKESAIKKYGGDLAYPYLAGFYTAWMEIFWEYVPDEIKDNYRRVIEKHIAENNK